MKKESTLTFKDLTKNLAWIKIIWNGQTIFDDEIGFETVKHYHEIEQKYADKIVYKMLVTITQFHHCILDIEGEEVK